MSLDRYIVWLTDEERDDGMRYAAHSDTHAAQQHAEHCHAQRDGWEWDWPVTFRVALVDSLESVDIEVERETEPVFYASGPVKHGCVKPRERFTIAAGAVTK